MILQKDTLRKAVCLAQALSATPRPEQTSIPPRRAVPRWNTSLSERRGQTSLHPRRGETSIPPRRAALRGKTYIPPRREQTSLPPRRAGKPPILSAARIPPRQTYLRTHT